MTEGRQPKQEPADTPTPNDAPHPCPTEQTPPAEEEPAEESTRPTHQDSLQNEIRAGWRRALGH